ncbi:F-type H+-transporting ATPase subunit epsilon [Kaistia hirudinis]|jgi:F-type H+-transporting ATPase subunit epsilon|uniref:ATP synthase epsilon chain n=1 Tax=Kaistia hirudinis TaxID=1293440 RepID=A0A840AMD0_9HYPH|nr:F0F1 ATP synthase subunit epsilon [Kaistia hirudinis]MBB3931480.1 F-type H+-transporting ATPase subunit epsilon [Kaistia hirudinis]MBN9016115.1 F0F1 ATP synthase subunit epsilon [Hyphomicrobiales bacterium]
MAEPFSFELVSPERLLFSEQVLAVVVPGTEGEFTVLKNMAPFMSTIKPGVITVTPVSGTSQRYFIRGGFADVSPTGLTILAEQAVPVESLDPNLIATEIKNAEEDLADATDDEAKSAAAQKIAQLKEAQAALAH